MKVNDYPEKVYGQTFVNYESSQYNEYNEYTEEKLDGNFDNVEYIRADLCEKPQYPQWKNVKTDGLPKDEVDVLVRTEYVVFIAYMISNKNGTREWIACDDEHNISDVKEITHWIDIPDFEPNNK